MPTYNYVAYNLKGEKFVGTRDAGDPAQLKVMLKSEKLILNSFTQKKEAKAKSGGSIFTSKKIKTNDIINFTRELGVMLESGLSLLGALTVQEKMLKDESPMKSFITNLKTVINQGESMVSGFLPYKDYFGDTYLSLVKVGEVSGTLGKTMEELAELLEKNEEIKKKVKGAMVYPVTVIGISLSISAFLIVSVLPSFVKMFDDTGSKLPVLTQTLLDLSDFIKSSWYLIAIFSVTGSIVLKKFLKTKEGKKAMNRILYKIPVIGNLFLQAVTLQFSRTLATLFDAGVAVLKSLEISANSVGDPLFDEKMAIARDEIQAGERIAQTLQKTGYFSIATISMMAVGEQSGEMVAMLKKIAAYNERQLNQIIKEALTLIEPIMMIFLGGIIGTIVLALYLPMFEMMSTAG